MATLKTQGTEVYILDSTDTGNEVRKIGQITNVGEFSPSTTEIETTDLDSTKKEFVNGLTDNGTITIQYNYDPQDSSQANLLSRQGGANVRFLIACSESSTDPTYSSGYTLPTDRTTFDFTAGVQNVGKGAQVDDIWRGSFTLRVSGEVTETAAS